MKQSDTKSNIESLLLGFNLCNAFLISSSLTLLRSDKLVSFMLLSIVFAKESNSGPFSTLLYNLL